MSFDIWWIPFCLAEEVLFQSEVMKIFAYIILSLKNFIVLSHKFRYSMYLEMTGLSTHLFKVYFGLFLSFCTWYKILNQHCKFHEILIYLIYSTLRLHTNYDRIFAIMSLMSFSIHKNLF